MDVNRASHAGLQDVLEQVSCFTCSCLWFPKVQSTKVSRFSMVNDLSSLDSTFPDSCIQAAYYRLSQQFFRAALFRARDFYHWEIVSAIAVSFFSKNQQQEHAGYLLTEKKCNCCFMVCYFLKRSFE